MYFNGIGRITDFIKTAQFEQKWQQKKIEISAANSKNSDKVSAFLNPDSDWIKTKRIEDIKNKMKSGRRLSHEEKEFLRIHEPKLYEKAMKIEKERDEFRRALSNCKTKEEAMRLKTSKCLELKIEADATSCKTKDGGEQGDMEFIAMRMMAIFDEFANFIKSEEYASIPNEYEEDDEEGEDTENNGKGGKSKFKKAILPLKEEMALNGYKLSKAKILNKAEFSEPAKPDLKTGTQTAHLKNI
ncbi:MAG: hypothetical protein LBQ76_01010 [Candidatus Fibromonas sp.]|jgi:hypothetical protein|nr:hypothetical protein [Candidatus Fibromonas sp.]